MSSLSEPPYVQSDKWVIKLVGPSRTNVRIKSDDQDPGKQEAYQQDIFLFLPCLWHGFQAGNWGAGWRKPLTGDHMRPSAV